MGKNIRSGVLLVTLATLFLLNIPPACADDVSSSYVVGKLGIYAPREDPLQDFDIGFNGEVALGYRKGRYALELEAGYLETTGKGSVVTSVSPPVIVPGDVKISIVPIALNYKIFFPIGMFEVFGEVGAGAYMADADLSGGGLSFSDKDTSGGIYVGVGANISISERLFLGIEGRYLWTGEYNFLLGQVPVNARLDGVFATANIGYRLDAPSGR